MSVSTPSTPAFLPEMSTSGAPPRIMVRGPRRVAMVSSLSAKAAGLVRCSEKVHRSALTCPKTSQQGRPTSEDEGAETRLSKAGFTSCTWSRSSNTNAGSDRDTNKVW
jgi:hypothetical protein